MNWRRCRKYFPFQKLLAISILLWLVPQAAYLVLKLICSILVILAIFVMFEIGVVLVIKSIYPERVNVSNIMEWTLNAFVKVGTGLATTIFYVLFGILDLIVAQVSGAQSRPQRSNSSGSQQLVAQRQERSQPQGVDQRPLLTGNRNGYTNMARAAMTNAGSKPSRPLRFSI